MGIQLHDAPPTITPDGPVMLTTRMLAERWHLAPGTIRQWRTKGTGPRFLRLEGRVLYDLRDVQMYESQSIVTPA